MAMTVHCDIVSAEGEIFSGLVEMVVAHGNLQGGAQEVFYISGGFLEVQPNMVKVLADTVQRAADLDEAQAQDALKAAENALHEKGAEFDYGAAAARLAEAAAQLRTVQQMRKGK